MNKYSNFNDSEQLNFLSFSVQEMTTLLSFKHKKETVSLLRMVKFCKKIKYSTMILNGPVNRQVQGKVIYALTSGLFWRGPNR
jgi:hypothetical protein